MRKTIIFTLTLLLLAVFISGCPDGTPQIELSTNYFDLGDINPDVGDRTETFFVKNTGKAPLKIISVSTSCGCTKAEIEADEIQPGEQAKLTVTYDSSVHPGLVGEIRRVVYVQSNDPLKEEVELELVGNVLPSGTK